MSTPFRLLLPRRLLDAMIAQALQELPNECCGLLGGRREEGGKVGRVVERYPLVNAEASPTRYQSEPQGLFHALRRDMPARGLEHLAIYHSHPTSAPAPSRTDLAQAFYPDVVYLILSMTTSPPTMRAWWLTEAGFIEAEWEIVGEAGME